MYVMERVKDVFRIIILLSFIIAVIILLSLIAIKDNRNYITKVGHPVDTIRIDERREMIVVEIHDLVRDSVYLDTITRYNRKLSTLEEHNTYKYK